MPKETIQSRYAGESFDAPEPHLHVGWTRDRDHVEVATRAGGDYADDLKRPGLFVQLDRDGINRLIRALRKARDAAFGADA